MCFPSRSISRRNTGVLRPFAVALSLAVGWLSPLNNLQAQPRHDASATQRAAAESLFDEALQLLEKKETSSACPKLEESQRLDPGVGTLLYLADCYQQLGRTASAWATFRDAAYRAKEAKDERATVAVQLADELKPRLSYLTIELDPGEQSEPTLTHNGETLGSALLGTAFPVDPGEHRLHALASDRQPWSTTLQIVEGPGRHRLKVPLLKAASVPPAGLERARSDSLFEGKSLAWGLVGLGGAGLIGATVFSVLALDANNEADESCRSDRRNLCNAEGVALGETASSRATWAAVSAGVGLLALGAGVSLLVLTPNAEETGASGSLRAVHQAGSTQLQWRSVW